jgi:hypothetical protein
MNQGDPINDPPKTVWHYVKQGLRRQHARRPVSFYLMLAIIVVLLLGLQMAKYREDAQRFALVLSCMFIFFFLVVWRASVEFMDIIRRGYREERDLFRNTLGSREFAEELGKRVAENVGETTDADGSGPPADD